MPKNLKDDLEVVDKIDIKALSEALGFKCALTKDFLRVAIANALLFDRKNLDYGPLNISEFGVVGCVIRSSDKFKRIANLYKANRKAPANEKLEDSYRDISNYQNIINMINLGLWPGI